MNSARKALRESRTLSLRRSLEGGAGSLGSSFREAPTDLEGGGSFLDQPLLEGEHEGYDEPPRGSLAAAAAAALATVDSGEAGGNGVLPAGPRDSRTLWRLARTKLGAPPPAACAHVPCHAAAAPAAAAAGPPSSASAGWIRCCAVVSTAIILTTPAASLPWSPNTSPALPLTFYHPLPPPPAAYRAVAPAGR